MLSEITDDSDGIALMAASIRHLVEENKAKCLIGTHFQELLNPSVLPRSLGMDFLRMAYLAETFTEQGDTEVVYLYTYAQFHDSSGCN
jgi:DNA mismatch repair ATPase MutS